MLCWFIQQSESAISIYPLPPYYLPPCQPSRSAQGTKLSFPCFPLTVLHMVVYTCQCYSLSSSHPLISLLCLQVCSLHLCLYSFPANTFISTVSLDYIYVCYWCVKYRKTIFVFLFLTGFTLYNRLYIHPPQFKWLTFIPFYG